MTEEQQQIQMRQLTMKHNLEEMAMFPVWQELSHQKQNEFVDKIGKRQADEIIKLIKSF